MTVTITVPGTDPYPWPWAGLPSPDRIALVVAGADPRWIARCAPSTARDAALRLGQVAHVLRSLGATVVHVEHDQPARAPEARPVPMSPTSIREPGDLVVTAGGIDGFFASTLDGKLRARRVDHLVIGGFGLEAPVHSTLRSANDQGYECLLLTDAAAPLVTDHVPAALSMVTMSGGIFGALGLSADLLTALTALADLADIAEPAPDPSPARLT